MKQSLLAAALLALTLAACSKPEEAPAPVAEPAPAAAPTTVKTIADKTPPPEEAILDEVNSVEKTDVPIHKGEPLALELRAFVDCVRSRSAPVVSGEHAAEALKLAVAICQSIRRGQT